MRNLIAFLKRFQIFLVFAFLQAIALSTYISYSSFPKYRVLTTAAAGNAKIAGISNAVSKHFHLEYQNKQLQLENLRLREKLKQSLYKTDKGRVYVDDTLYKQQYQYIPATVVRNTYDKRNNYMTIDVGTEDGVKREDGVFSSRGVVGIIHFAGPHYSLVKTLLTKNINIDAMLKPGGAFGLIKWDGENPKRGSLSGISNDIPVKKWTSVVTRGGSNIFPRGLLIGRVVKKAYIEGKPLWDIEIAFAEDFRSVESVYVVKNLMLNELESIEKKIPVDKEEKDL